MRQAYQIECFCTQCGDRTIFAQIPMLISDDAPWGRAPEKVITCAKGHGEFKVALRMVLVGNPE